MSVLLKIAKLTIPYSVWIQLITYWQARTFHLALLSKHVKWDVELGSVKWCKPT